MKIYLASSWRNTEQPAAVAALRAAGHEVYDFRNPPNGDPGFSWREIDGGWQAWTPAAYREALRHPAARRGFKNDMDALRAADVCVMLQPCGRSAALELAWAVGAGRKTVVVLSEGSEPELMLAMADDLCLSVAEAIHVLKGGSQ